MSESISRADAAQRSASDPTVSIWVAASAGTGKTKVLTDRVLRLMLGGDETPTLPNRILCLTFTKAAAAEMANRLAHRLGRWAVMPADELKSELQHLSGAAPSPELVERARRLLAAVLETPGGMRIQTIHAFCQTLLARFPLEAGVSPHFEVVDERSAEDLLGTAREELIAHIDPDSGDALARALDVITRNVHETRLADLLAELTRERGRLARLRLRHGGVVGLLTSLRDRLELAAGETSDSVLREACADGTFARDPLRAAAAALTEGSARDAEHGRVIADWLALDDADARHDNFATYRLAFFTKDGKLRAKLLTKKVDTSAEEPLIAEAKRLLALDQRLRNATIAEATEAILIFATALLDAYDAKKRARNWLDYDDLILHTQALLAAGSGRAAWVLYKLDGGLDHILVDEAQDTNPDQWAVVEALANEFFAGAGARDIPRTIFGVGDAKQSIYGFQRADPRIFAGTREQFRARVQAAERRWEQVPLDVSFRSTTAVLDTVDRVFADAAARDGLLFGESDVAHESARIGQAGLVELWAPVEPEAEDMPAPWKPPVERGEGESSQSRFADILAGRIAAMCNGSDRLESHDRAIQPGDIMVLVRRRNTFMDELVRRLKERDVPVAGIDRLVLTNHIAVMDLLSLGRFLLLPDDDLSLAETLKSPMFGLDDDDLFSLAYGRGERNLWQVLLGRQHLKASWGVAARTLSDLLARADRMTPYELFAEALSRPHGRQAILARLGTEAIDPLDELLAQALAFERAHLPSLQGFLHWLDSGDVVVKRDLDVGGGGGAVRVMTVHGAKGLEAPIVFLPDSLQAPAHSPMLAWDPENEGVLWPPSAAMRNGLSEAWIEEAKGRDREEYRRLLYVAMTRAADRLYVCGWRDRRKEPVDCWYHLVRTGLEELGKPVGDGTPGTPILRHQVNQAAEPDSVSQPSDVSRSAKAPDWTRYLPPPEPTPPVPLVPSAMLAEEPPTRSPLAPEVGTAAERGRLIHRLLQSLPNLALTERAEACRRFLARPALTLSPEACEEITAATLAVMDSADFGPVFGPGSRAEVPIAGALPVSGAVLSGQIDRLVVTDDAVLAVDYKTGRGAPATPADAPAPYLRQMAAYRAGLRLIYPGHRIHCGLLWTEQPALMALPNALLDAHAPA